MAKKKMTTEDYASLLGPPPALFEVPDVLHIGFAHGGTHEGINIGTLSGGTANRCYIGTLVEGVARGCRIGKMEGGEAEGCTINLKTGGEATGGCHIGFQVSMRPKE